MFCVKCGADCPSSAAGGSGTYDYLWAMTPAQARGEACLSPYATGTATIELVPGNEKDPYRLLKYTLN
ncbi:MAG: hypothetical protein RR281_01250 [Pseudoflavonifractor sp.]